VSPDSIRVRQPAFKLRPATSADRELLFQVYASTRTEELAVVDWPPATLEGFLRQQFDAQDRHYRQTFPAATFDVVVIDGQRAGRLYLDTAPDETRVLDIALLPEYRGRGVGTQLIGEVAATARGRGACVTLHVERTNRALAWYQRLGFSVAGDQGVYLFLRWLPPGDIL